MKRRYTVYTFFVVVFLVVLIGTFSTKPLYMATTKVLIERVEPSALVTNAPYAPYSPYDPDFYETQYQLIKSVAVGRKVVDMLNLEKTYGSFFGDAPASPGSGGLLHWIGSLFGAQRAAPAPTEEQREAKADAIAKAISAGIVVKPVKNSKIVDISFYSPNRELAKAVSDTVARAYIEELLDLNMSSTRFMVQWMKQKAEDEKDKLEKAEKALQEYVKSRNFVTVENKIAIIPQQISELNGQLIKAETKKKEMEVLYNKVKDVSLSQEAETIAVIGSDPGLQVLRQQIMKAEQNVLELSQKYGKKHPSLIRATEELSGLKAKKEQEIKRIIESVKNEYEIARSNETNLRRMLSQTKGEALDLNEKFGEYTILNREVETNRQMYDALVKKIKEQSVTEQGRTVNVLIVEKAETPKSPVKPRKGLNILLGIFVGVLGGIGMAFFVEYLDNTVKAPEDAEAALNVPVFGMVPLLKSLEKPVEKLVLSDPKSNFAESYKAIRTAILLSSAERPPKKLLITSSGPGEGKTTTAVNLALAIALSENKVLLIDADLRKPRIHKIFGLNNAKGLSTYLSGASDMNVIQEGPLPNLGVIPSGPIPPNPSELLSSVRVSEMIAALGERYDIIIIDSPPLLTVADSLVLSKVPDGTILVTMAGKTTYDLAQRGLKSLASLDARVLGMVINGMDIKKGDYYYYRYHNYYYSSEEADT